MDNRHNNSATAVAGYDEDAIQSVIVNADSLKTFDFVNARVEEIKTALQQPIPVLLCRDSLNAAQQLAQIIALFDTVFTPFCP